MLPMLMMTPRALAQGLDGVARQQQWRAQVEGKDPVEDLWRHVVHGRARGVHGVVDEDVDLAEALEGDIDQSLAVVHPHKVGLLEDRLLPQPLRDRRAILGRQPAHDDLGALFDKERRDRGAQSLSAAGHDRDFSRQELTHSSP